MQHSKWSFNQQWNHFITHKGKARFVKYDNFYETVKEANIRLKGTVVWYNGPGEQGPYYVLVVTNSPDGKFKIYMKPLGEKLNSIPGATVPSEIISYEHEEMAKHMDKYMKSYPQAKIVRKDLSSPYFNSFRPFPLGMMNRVLKNGDGKPVDCETLYLERQPNRLTQQGLISSMIYLSPVTAALGRDPEPANYRFDMHSESFRDCIMGIYPNVDECMSKMRDPKIANEAVAFSRYFALVRGPIDMLFLAYKSDIVGLLDNSNLSQITVGREHRYTREAIQELNIFKDIRER